METTRTSFRGPRPTGPPTGETGPRRGPLAGLRIVELAGIGPVPFACMMLADLGAEVIRVDRADGRRPFGGWHRVLDRGRRSVALDLKDPEGVAAVLRLADRADVVVEGFRPGVAERLGIGPEACRDRNPALVYARMTGWGQDGPLASAPGHDINYIALTGALDAIGTDGGAPVPPVNLLGDFAGGGMLLVCGILAALHERRRSGLGQTVDTAIVDGTASLLGMLLAMRDEGSWDGPRGANLLDGGAPFYTTYPCADGGHVAVGALEERFYADLIAGLGLPAHSLPDRADRTRWPALREAFAARFATRSRDAWTEAFAGTQACVTPVLTLPEAAGHPQLSARGTYIDTGTGTEPAPAPRFDRTPAPDPGPAPTPGEHTRQVLSESGLTPSEIDALIARGAALAAHEEPLAPRCPKA
ncbi:CaiB/BaiF CoA transferase family protein [Streptomyces sp. NPDC127049]|uniref:CaiB/BaiF CoA transferase family protein n=1 Tax=Streptomyces sp. NPDC127049 TaxID=3347118 RepID=UPI00364D0DEA